MAYPIEESEVEKTEKQLGAKLPEAYRKSMIEENGKNFIITEEDEWELFPLKDASNRKKLARTAYDILKETESALNWPNFPKDSIVIANNGMGDLLFLKKDEKNFEDTIYAFWHETGEVKRFAESFDELERE